MAQTSLTKSDLEQSVRQWIDDLVWRQEIRRAETGGFDYLTNDEIATLGTEDARELEGLFRFVGDRHTNDQKKAIADILHGKRDLGTLEPIVQSAASVMNEPLDTATIDGRLLTRTILRGYATFLDEIRETVAAIPKHAAPLAPAAPPIPSFAFLQFWDEFEAHKTANRDWKADTASNARGARTIFARLFPGATVADLLSSSLVSDLKTKLLALPRNHSRGNWLTMSPEEMMRRATAKSAPKMTATTVNKHFGNLIGYWDYLVEKNTLQKTSRTLSRAITSRAKRAGLRGTNVTIGPGHLRGNFSRPRGSPDANRSIVEAARALKFIVTRCFG